MHRAIQKLLFFIAAFFFTNMISATDFYFLEIHPDGFRAWGELKIGPRGQAQKQVFENGEPDFWEKLTADLKTHEADSTKNDVLFFLHGMSGDREPYFSNVMRQMQRDYVQAADCPVRRIVCLMWKPEKMGYKNIAQQAAPALAVHFSTIFEKMMAFQKTVAAPLGSRFHLLGNSMAARLFCLAFENLEPPMVENLPFASLLFAAADVRVADFPDRPAFQKMPRLAAQTLFFFNKKDNALRYAQLVNGEPMLGRLGPSATAQLPERIFFIETTHARSRTLGGIFSQHTYFSHSAEVVERIRAAMRR